MKKDFFKIIVFIVLVYVAVIPSISKSAPNFRSFGKYLLPKAMMAGVRTLVQRARPNRGLYGAMASLAAVTFVCRRAMQYWSIDGVYNRACRVLFQAQSVKNFDGLGNDARREEYRQTLCACRKSRNELVHMTDSIYKGEQKQKSNFVSKIFNLLWGGDILIAKAYEKWRMVPAHSTFPGFDEVTTTLFQESLRYQNALYPVVSVVHGSVGR